MIWNLPLNLALALLSGWPNEDSLELTSNFSQQETADAVIDFEEINYEKLNRLIFEATNQARKSMQLPALQYSQALEKAAFEHSQSMALKGYFSHKGQESGKQKLSDRLALVGVPRSFLAENIATTWGGEHSAFNHFSKNRSPVPPTPYRYEEVAETVVNQWMSSPGHRANILNPNLKYLGCGAMLRPYVDVDDTPIFLVTQCFSAEQSILPNHAIKIDYRSATILSAQSFKKVFKPKQP